MIKTVLLRSHDMLLKENMALLLLAMRRWRGDKPRYRFSPVKEGFALYTFSLYLFLLLHVRDRDGIFTYLDQHSCGPDVGT
jgi:hypothetical protein